MHSATQNKTEKQIRTRQKSAIVATPEPTWGSKVVEAKEPGVVQQTKPRPKPTVKRVPTPQPQLRPTVSVDSGPVLQLTNPFDLLEVEDPGEVTFGTASSEPIHSRGQLERRLEAAHKAEDSHEIERLSTLEMKYSDGDDDDEDQEGESPRPVPPQSHRVAPVGFEALEAMTRIDDDLSVAAEAATHDPDVEKKQPPRKKAKDEAAAAVRAHLREDSVKAVLKTQPDQETTFELTEDEIRDFGIVQVPVPRYFTDRLKDTAYVPQEVYDFPKTIWKNPLESCKVRMTFTEDGVKVRLPLYNFWKHFRLALEHRRSQRQTKADKPKTAFKDVISAQLDQRRKWVMSRGAAYLPKWSSEHYLDVPMSSATFKAHFKEPRNWARLAFLTEDFPLLPVMRMVSTFANVSNDKKTVRNAVKRPTPEAVDGLRLWILTQPPSLHATLNRALTHILYDEWDEATVEDLVMIRDAALTRRDVFYRPYSDRLSDGTSRLEVEVAHPTVPSMVFDELVTEGLDAMEEKIRLEAVKKVEEATKASVNFWAKKASQREQQQPKPSEALELPGQHISEEDIKEDTFDTSEIDAFLRATDTHQWSQGDQQQSGDSVAQVYEPKSENYSVFHDYLKALRMKDPSGNVKWKFQHAKKVKPTEAKLSAESEVSTKVVVPNPIAALPFVVLHYEQAKALARRVDSTIDDVTPTVLCRQHTRVLSIQHRIAFSGLADVEERRPGFIVVAPSSQRSIMLITYSQIRRDKTQSVLEREEAQPDQDEEPGGVDDQDADSPPAKKPPPSLVVWPPHREHSVGKDVNFWFPEEARDDLLEKFVHSLTRSGNIDVVFIDNPVGPVISLHPTDRALLEAYGVDLSHVRILDNPRMPLRGHSAMATMACALVAYLERKTEPPNLKWFSEAGCYLPGNVSPHALYIGNKTGSGRANVVDGDYIVTFSRRFPIPAGWTVKRVSKDMQTYEVVTGKDNLRRVTVLRDYSGPADALVFQAGMVGLFRRGGPTKQGNLWMRLKRFLGLPVMLTEVAPDVEAMAYRQGTNVTEGHSAARANRATFVAAQGVYADPEVAREAAISAIDSQATKGIVDTRSAMTKLGLKLHGLWPGASLHRTAKSIADDGMPYWVYYVLGAVGGAAVGFALYKFGLPKLTKFVRLQPEGRIMASHVSASQQLNPFKLENGILTTFPDTPQPAPVSFQVLRDIVAEGKAYYHPGLSGPGFAPAGAGQELTATMKAWRDLGAYEALLRMAPADPGYPRVPNEDFSDFDTGLASAMRIIAHAFNPSHTFSMRYAYPVMPAVNGPEYMINMEASYDPKSGVPLTRLERIFSHEKMVEYKDWLDTRPEPDFMNKLLANYTVTHFGFWHADEIQDNISWSLTAKRLQAPLQEELWKRAGARLLTKLGIPYLPAKVLSGCLFGAFESRVVHGAFSPFTMALHAGLTALPYAYGVGAHLGWNSAAIPHYTLDEVGEPAFVQGFGVTCSMNLSPITTAVVNAFALAALAIYDHRNRDKTGYILLEETVKGFQPVYGTALICAIEAGTSKESLVSYLPTAVMHATTAIVAQHSVFYSYAMHLAWNLAARSEEVESPKLFDSAKAPTLADVCVKEQTEAGNTGIYWDPDLDPVESFPPCEVNKITILEHMDCLPKVSTRAVGAYISGAGGIVKAFTPRQCQHNQLQAVRFRVLRNQIGVVDDRFVPEALELLCKYVPKFTGAVLPTKEWIKRFSGSKGRAYEIAWREYNAEISRLKYSVFVKREKTLKLGDPRAIQMTGEPFRLFQGAYIKALATHIAEVTFHEPMRTGKPALLAYTSGANAEQIGRWFTSAIELVEDPVFIEIDISRMDASVDVAWLDALHAFYEHNRAPKTVLDYCRSRRSVGGFGLGFSYWMTGRVKSGDADTSLGDTLIGLMVILVWLFSVASGVDQVNPRSFSLLNGDDNITIISAKDFHALGGLDTLIEVFRDAGFTVEASIKEVYDVSFLSAYFWDLGTECVLGPKPGRVLAKSFWRLDPDTKDLKWLRSTIDSLYCYRFVPLLGEVVLHIRSLLLAASVQGLKGGLPTEWEDRVVAVESHDVTETAIAQFLEIYSATRLQYDEAVTEARGQITLPLKLTHPLFSKVVEVDNGIDHDVVSFLPLL